MKIEMEVGIRGDYDRFYDLGTMEVEIELEPEVVTAAIQSAIREEAVKVTLRETKKAIAEAVHERVRTAVAPRIDVVFNNAMKQIDNMSDDELFDIAFEKDI